MIFIVENIADDSFHVHPHHILQNDCTDVVGFAFFIVLTMDGTLEEILSLLMIGPVPKSGTSQRAGTVPLANLVRSYFYSRRVAGKLYGNFRPTWSKEILYRCRKMTSSQIEDEVISYNFYTMLPSYNRSLPDQRYDQIQAYSFSRKFLCRSFLAKTYSGYRQSHPSLVPSAADRFAIQQ